MFTCVAAQFRHSSWPKPQLCGRGCSLWNGHGAGGGHCWVLWFHRCSRSSFFTYMKVLWLSCCLDFSSVPSNFFPILRDHFSFAICNETFIPQKYPAHQSFLSKALLLLLILYSFYIQGHTHTHSYICVYREDFFPSVFLFFAVFKLFTIFLQLPGLWLPYRFIVVPNTLSYMSLRKSINNFPVTPFLCHSCLLALQWDPSTHA